MFFLKDLPSQQMIERYSEQFFPGKVSDISQTLSNLRAYSLLIRRLEEYFGLHDLSQLRFLVMMVIDREPERDSLYAYEIADKLDVSKPVLSRAIAKLKEQSLLSASQDTEDARAVNLFLTVQGKALLKSILPDYFNFLINAESHTGYIKTELSSSL